MNKFEELCEKYNKTADEVTFEYENLSDEELEVAFKEAFEEVEEETETVVEETVAEENSEETVVEESVEEVIEETTEVVAEEPIEEVVEPEKFTKTFTVELSHDDIRNALYTLIRQYENDDEYFYIREVFDSYFVMQDWWNNKIYKQNYAIDGENISLDGDRIEVYEILVTKEEKDALDALKENYSALEVQYNELKAFKDNYDAAELKAKKDAIFAREEYSSIVETKAFKKLMEDSVNYTLEECEQKANSILEDCNDYITNFAAKDNETNKPKTLGLNFNAKPSKKKTAYGGLFDKDE